MECVICKKEFDGHGNNAEPLAKGFCCALCNGKVITARQNASKWSTAVSCRLYQTCGINSAIADDLSFAKKIMSCLGKYLKMDWGDTCKSDWRKNDKAVFLGNDRVVALYKTDKGNVFIITEYDRSATTILFGSEY